MESVSAIIVGERAKPGEKCIFLLLNDLQSERKQIP
jgi:hypothetical protein